MKHLVVLTGAGISAESGLKTFRDANGLWEDHDVMEVASPEGFSANPKLVFEFYNQRRKQLLNVNPNKAHLDLAKLENLYKVTIITQNVDDLHERAGSTNVIHLHGELFKVRSTKNKTHILNWTKDLNLGHLDDKGHQLRPHIVWFGEAVPLIDDAIELCQTADLLFIIGTSMQVYPAAGLMNYVSEHIPVYYIDKNPAKVSKQNIKTIAKPATIGVEEAISNIKLNH